MGLAVSKLLNALFERKNLRILMVGLDGAGKTTILYKLKLGEVITSIPTIGFNVETVEYKNIRFTVWDIGGQNRIRPLWKRYFQNTHGIIFVVDSTDRDRIAEVSVELKALLEDEQLRQAVLLIFANKQDLPSAMRPTELVDRLRLGECKGRKWYIQSACATMSHGVYEGLEWLAKELAKR